MSVPSPAAPAPPVRSPRAAAPPARPNNSRTIAAFCGVIITIGLLTWWAFWSVRSSFTTPRHSAAAPSPESRS